MKWLISANKLNRHRHVCTVRCVAFTLAYNYWYFMGYHCSKSTFRSRYKICSSLFLNDSWLFTKELLWTEQPIGNKINERVEKLISTTFRMEGDAFYYYKNWRGFVFDCLGRDNHETVLLLKDHWLFFKCNKIVMRKKERVVKKEAELKSEACCVLTLESVKTGEIVNIFSWTFPRHHNVVPPPTSLTDSFVGRKSLKTTKKQAANKQTKTTNDRQNSRWREASLHIRGHFHSAFTAAGKTRWCGSRECKGEGIKVLIHNSTTHKGRFVGKSSIYFGTNYFLKVQWNKFIDTLCWDSKMVDSNKTWHWPLIFTAINYN